MKRIAPATSPQEKGTLYWLQVGFPEPGEAFLTFTEEYTRPLFERLLAIPNRHFRGSWEVQRLFEETLAVYFTQPGPLQEIALTAHVIGRPCVRLGSSMGAVCLFHAPAGHGTPMVMPAPLLSKAARLLSSLSTGGIDIIPASA